MPGESWHAAAGEEFAGPVDARGLSAHDATCPGHGRAAGVRAARPPGPAARARRGVVPRPHWQSVLGTSTVPEYSRVLKGKERLRAGRSAADTMGATSPARLSGVLRQLTARAASMAPAATELAAVALGKSL